MASLERDILSEQVKGGPRVPGRGQWAVGRQCGGQPRLVPRPPGRGHRQRVERDQDQEAAATREAGRVLGLGLFLHRPTSPLPHPG